MINDQHHTFLLSLKEQLFSLEESQKKQAFLFKHPQIVTLFEQCPHFKKFLVSLPKEKQLILLTFFIVDPENELIFSFNDAQESRENFSLLADLLLQVESFYHEMGGLLGYYLSMIQLIRDSENRLPHFCEFSKPPLYDLTKNEKAVKQATKEGLYYLEKMGAIFPMGGSGDRLDLIDEKSHDPLPTAFLPFWNKTLFEGLIRDLQALEYFYYQTYGKKLCTPIAIMTSEAKKNHERILTLLEKNHWFDRPKESFKLFQQISVPLVTTAGNWGMKDPSTLDMKPGGHGVLWKLMEEKKVFSWFLSQGRTHGFVRQINNPMGGIDFGLLALIGIGMREKKKMGFASCPRLVGAPEGMNVLCQYFQGNENIASGITNIEYTDFQKWKIPDEPEEKQGLFSKFPANTNLLFVDLKAIQKALSKTPFPGLIANMKNETFSFSNGSLRKTKGGRLELMMQNIAEALIDPLPADVHHEQMKKKLSTFLTFNERRKTISTTKRSFSSSHPINGTPEGAYFDYLLNVYELLADHCHLSLPKMGTIDSYLQKGPPLHFLFHPALGPLFAEISKKIQGGSLAPFSEVQIELIAMKWKNVHVDGSLLIVAEELLNQKDPRDITSSCTLENVTFKNAGIDTEQTACYWKNQIFRKECFSLRLSEDAHFFAKNVTFTGPLEVTVPPHHTMRVFMDGNNPEYCLSRNSL